ncbi:MAG TPA: UDP-N-acetylmuramate--L-alanine ligase [Cytophagaceae bacterium]
MDLKQVHRVYFIGIGGIGMSALARWFKVNGYEVAGYDKTITPLTKELSSEGMAIHYEDNSNNIPDAFRDKNTTLVVYTPAIPENHEELQYFRKEGYIVKKRSEVLGMITKDAFTIAISGTHGKTTTSSMVAHVLTYAGIDCTAFLGGITLNYKSNLLLNKNKDKKEVVVVEADEYDRSFLTLHPDIAVITTVDADHLDIYNNTDAFRSTFVQFVGQIKEGGIVYVRDIVDLDFPASVQKQTFGTEKGEITTRDLRIENSRFTFDVTGGGMDIKGVVLQVPGYHNVENALAAISVANKMGIDGEVIKAALAEFRGVKRRFEYIYKGDSVVYIDDYAHHPTELEAFFKGVKALYADKKFTVIFQPHLYSRTRDFMKEFGKSLSLADEVILLDIYPARELPIPGVTSSELLKEITHDNKRLVAKNELLDVVQKLKTDVLATVGAGDIDQFVIPIKELLEKKYEKV